MLLFTSKYFISHFSDLTEDFLEAIDGDQVFYDKFKEPQGYPIDPTSEIYMDVPINAHEFSPFYPENFQSVQTLHTIADHDIFFDYAHVQADKKLIINILLFLVKYTLILFPHLIGGLR